MNYKKLAPIALLVIGYSPMLFLHFSGISKREQYQYWPFVVLAVGYMVWARRSFEAPMGSYRSGMVSVLFGIAFFFLLAGSLIFTPWVGAISAIFALAAVIVATPTLRCGLNIFGIWMLSWLVIPPPFGLDNKLVSRLQRLSSSASSQILDLLRIDHLMAGNTLQVPDKQFFVDEACSGIISVMSIIAAGAIYVVWNNRTYLHSALLLVAGVAWAVAMNIARIVTIAFAYERLGIDLSAGAPHEILGLVLFMFTFCALMSTDQALCFGLDQIETRAADNDTRSPLVQFWNRFASLGNPYKLADAAAEKQEAAPKHTGPTPGLLLSSLFALVGVAFAGILIAGTSRSAVVLEQSKRVSQSTLPKVFRTLRQTGYENQHRDEKIEFGEYSNSFTFVDSEEQTIQLSFDYPFPAEQGWKELTTCYRGVGWKVTSRQVIEETSKSGKPWNVVQVTMINSTGQFGYLLFSHFDGTGEPVSPPDGFWEHAFWTRGRRFKAYTQSPHMFQSQLWSLGTKEITEEKRDEMLKTYLEARELFRADFLGGGSAPSG